MFINWYPLAIYGPPAAGVPVLVTVATMRPMVRVATWQPRYTMPLHEDGGGEGEWHEDSDMCYAPEGWYPAALPDNEEPLWRISYAVTAWASLPDAHE